MLNSNDTTGDNSQGSSPTLLQFLEQHLWNRVRVSLGESAQHLEVHAEGSDGSWEHVADFGFVEMTDACWILTENGSLIEGELGSFAGPNCERNYNDWFSDEWRVIGNLSVDHQSACSVTKYERLRVVNHGQVAIPILSASEA